jgi:hypothetical protein
MEEITSETIEKHYKALPNDLREAIKDKHIEESIFAIGKKRGLHIDNLGILLIEVHNFILGITNPRDFKHQLTKSLSIDSSAADDLIDDLNREIFLPVRDSLQLIHGDGGSGERDAAKNFVTQNLNQTKQTEEKKTDHSINRAEGVDPYREAID